MGGGIQQEDITILNIYICVCVCVCVYGPNNGALNILRK